MTVIDPDLSPCPNCGATTFDGDMRVNNRINLDGQGGVFSMERTDDSLAFESLECPECDHVMIENGEIVDDAVVGAVI